MIMGDNPPNKMRKTYLLMRGQYASTDNQGDSSRHARLLPPWRRPPKTVWDWQSGYWIRTSPNCRVTVNRYWQTIFGRPIVATLEILVRREAGQPILTFFLVGQDFVDHGWNKERLNKWSWVQSPATSSTRPEHLKVDPTNMYHARTRFRLMGEFTE